MNCVQCGREFPVIASRAERTKYCSKVCFGKAHQKRITYICASCKKVFYDDASSKRIFCSQECAKSEQARRIRHLRLTELERSQTEALVIEYEPLVKSIVNRLLRQLNPRIMDFDDFMQEGRIGLLTAYQQDKDPALPFAPFAAVHIRYAILAAWYTQEPLIRLPGSLFRKEANVTDEEMYQYKRLTLHTSLDAIPPNGELAPCYEHVETAVEDAEQTRILYRCLRALPERQRTLLVQHYGLVGAEIAMRQLAYRYGLAIVTTFREIQRALTHLRRTEIGRYD